MWQVSNLRTFFILYCTCFSFCREHWWHSQWSEFESQLNPSLDGWSTIQTPQELRHTTVGTGGPGWGDGAQEGAVFGRSSSNAQERHMGGSLCPVSSAKAASHGFLHQIPQLGHQGAAPLCELHIDMTRGLLRNVYSCLWSHQTNNTEESPGWVLFFKVTRWL